MYCIRCKICGEMDFSSKKIDNFECLGCFMKRKEEEEKMEQELQKMKEQIRAFVVKNKVKEFYVDIERGAHIPTDVELTIKV